VVKYKKKKYKARIIMDEGNALEFECYEEECDKTFDTP
jgi:hypothetical protein